VCECVSVLSWELKESFLHLSSEWKKVHSAGGGANPSSSANHTAQIHSPHSSRTDVFIRTESISIRSLCSQTPSANQELRATHNHPEKSRDAKHTHSHLPRNTFPCCYTRTEAAQIQRHVCVCRADQRTAV